MIVIVVLAAIVAICGFLVSILVLWFYGRVLKAEKATLARAAAACLLMTLLTIAATRGTLAFDDQLLELAPQALVAVTLAELSVEFLIACLCVCWLFRTSFGRAVLIWLCSVVTNVVLAIALALALRTTCAEAFVVPTGAMSPTLYGMHCYKDCDNCGYKLAAGVTYRLGYAPSETAITTCTNCGQSVEILPSDATISGDRILANKLAEPKRWDLVVFHPPQAPEAMYVKRLVGLPGEEVETREGDIFTNGRRQRKLPGTVTELWLPVHDTAFRPATPPDNERRCWRSQSDETLWQWVEDEGWRFSGGPGQHGDLTFSEPVLDQLAYNTDDRPYKVEEEWQAVRDVKVTCAVSKFRGDGHIGFNWRFGKDTVNARVSAGRYVAIVQVNQGSNGETNMDAKQARAQGKLPSRLAGSTLTFAFRDGMAYVMQDDSLIVSLVLEDGKADSPGNEPKENQEIGIFAEDCSATLQRIQLFRDVYYLTVEEMKMGSYMSGAAPNPIQLSDQQYLFFGDNSRQSQDARFFGPAAADSVKGVVSCIYWPPERWRQFGSPVASEGG